MSWVNKFFGLFGLQIEKIPTKLCVFCDNPLPEEPAKVIVNDGSEVEICETCEKILELSNKAVLNGRAQAERDDDGDEPI